MPVKDKVTKEAYCDVCGQNGAGACAVCGGLFCCRHSTFIEFRPRSGYNLQRIACKECLSKATMAAIIKGLDISSWRGEDYSVPKEVIDGLLLKEEV